MRGTTTNSEHRGHYGAQRLALAALLLVALCGAQTAAFAGGNNEKAPVIYWRNGDTGRNAMQYFAGEAPKEVQLITPVEDPNWQMRGVADFDGDGNLDIVWRNKANGDNRLQRMQPPKLACKPETPPRSREQEVQSGRPGPPPPEAVLACKGKKMNDPCAFNSPEGEELVGVCFRPQENSTFVPLPHMAPNWQLAAVADFTGEGKPNLLWRNRENGDIFVEQLATLDHEKFSKVGRVGNMDWQIVGAADFDKDGIADLIWRNVSNGANLIGLLDAEQHFRKFLPFPAIPTPNWNIVGAEDFSNTGNVDILWWNAANGKVALEHMDGAQHKDYQILTTISNTSWRPWGVGKISVAP